MRGARFRARLWIAGAILGLTLAGACNLNPQPLPPGSESPSGNDEGTPSPASSSGAGSGSSSGSTFTSSSSGGGNAGGGLSAPADAGALAELDASVEDGGDNAPPPVEIGDAGSASDGAPDGGSPDAASDAGPDASPDAAQDDASTSAGCIRASDCSRTHPGACAFCAWPFDYPVCAERVCRCACDALNAGGD